MRRREAASAGHQRAPVSAFHDAVRQMQQADLVCQCGAMNIPGKPAVILIEPGDEERAGCCVCGRYGPLKVFRRKD